MARGSSGYGRLEIARPLGLRTLGWCTEPGNDTTATSGHQYLGPGKNQPAVALTPMAALQQARGLSAVRPHSRSIP